MTLVEWLAAGWPWVIAFCFVFGVLFYLGFSGSKKADLLKNYEIVRVCCCFPSVLSSNEYSEILEVPVWLNEVLEPSFSITNGDNIVDYFLLYRQWLLEKYMNANFRFSSKYNTKNQRVFFAQTFIDFSNRDFEKPIGNGYYELSVGAAKMILGAMCILKQSGDRSYNSKIKHFQCMLS